MRVFRTMWLKQPSFSKEKDKVGFYNTPEYHDNSFQLTKPFPASKTKMSFNWYEE